MNKWQAIVFDLDDTLYPERDYVRSGFRCIANELEESCSISRNDVFSFLWKLFEEGVRGDSFDRLLLAYPQVADRLALLDLVTIYRSHHPDIMLAPEIFKLLVHLRAQGVLLGLISDGSLRSQEAKVIALGLNQLIDSVVLTGQWGPKFWKPHPRGFMAVIQGWKLKPEHIAYVADNPLKDFLTPKRLGWHTMRLRMENQLHFHRESPSPEHEADIEVCSISDLISNLKVVA